MNLAASASQEDEADDEARASSPAAPATPAARDSEPHTA